MRNLNRSTLVLVLVAVLGMTFAAIVAARSTSSQPSAMGTYGSSENTGQVGLADTSATTTSTALTDPLIVDPAKAQPILDQFHSRDPFIQITAAPTSGGSPAPVPTGTSSPSPSPSSVPTGATVTIKGRGTFTDQPVGKVLLAKYKIAGITSSSVKFTLVNGWTLADSSGTSTGKTAFTVQTGTVLKVTTVKGSHVVTDFISVKIVFTTSGGGGGEGGATAGGGTGGGEGGGTAAVATGHTIKVLSIDTQNGTASVTLVVDGVTFANKKVGDVFTTGWGQIKILGINVGAQTVTILHADVQITLHVGQTASK